MQRDEEENSDDSDDLFGERAEVKKKLKKRERRLKRKLAGENSDESLSESEEESESSSDESDITAVGYGLMIKFDAVIIRLLISCMLSSLPKRKT